ncbi:MAG: M56 family metallopeptidase, partial [Pseudomonadota bacterium]
MITELSGVLQSLLMSLLTLSLVLSAPVVLVLLLRKPVRVLLGSIACYRLWLLALLWLPAYLLGEQLLRGWQILRARVGCLQAYDVGDFQLLLNDLVWQPLNTIGSRAAGSTSVSLDVWDVATLLWVTGAVAVIAWQLNKYRLFSQRLQQQARCVQPADKPAAEVNAVFGNTLPALVLPGMSSAALFGIRKPVLLLPESFGDNYDADQQHIILSHEAVHLRRHDNAWNLAAGLLVVLCWPNPLFWLAWRCYRFDQELSCDAHALASCNQTQQRRYARTLLDAASTTVGIGPQPALSAWDNLDDLKERTLMIAQHLKNKVSPLVMQSCLSVIAVGGAVVMVLLAGSFSPVTVAAEPVQANTAVSDTRRVSAEAGELFRQYAELVNAKKQEEAFQLLPKLQEAIDSGKLSDFETSRALQMMFSSYVWKKQYDEARMAMEKAIQSGGYNESE